MTFKQQEAFIPYGQTGDLHTESLTTYENGDEKITVRQPGKYQDKTMGGDFVVCYTGILNGKQAKSKRVTYQDLFKHWVGIDTDERRKLLTEFSQGIFNGVFAQAVCTLTVAEYRRYKQHERCSEASYAFPVVLSDSTVQGRTGGRWLLLNYLVLLHGAPALLDDACKLVKLGSTGLQILTKETK